MFGLTQNEIQKLSALNTPRKIQDFIDGLVPNYEIDGISCKSPRMSLKHGTVHCMEGALLSALAFRVNGERPLIVDLTTTQADQDHVITVFKMHGAWGAISKSNHAILRYREPVYRTIRELVLSFFHEYTNDDGRKTLRSYTRPIDLTRFDHLGWMTSEDDVWYIPEYIANSPHISILSKPQISTLRRADDIERKAGQLVQWKIK
ncbi:MAG: hypothetical protein ABIB04_03050 [Patescibacteria group bacterium]